jgi:DNA-binding MarR family transcriptional regulator
MPPLSDIDRVVHEPARFMILSQLYVVEAADFLFVMRQIGLTQGNLSSHLAKLEEAGYVGVHKEFVDKRPRTLLRLTDQGRTAFEGYVARMKRLLDGVPVQDSNRRRRHPLRQLRPKPATR